MNENGLHPITKKPWTCACPSVESRACYESRYPRPIVFAGEEEPEDDLDDRRCECSCHDFEGERDDDEW